MWDNQAESQKSFSTSNESEWIKSQVAQSQRKNQHQETLGNNPISKYIVPWIALKVALMIDLRGLTPKLLAQSRFNMLQARLNRSEKLIKIQL